MRVRIAWLLLSLLVAACEPAPVPLAPLQAGFSRCRVGPDGAMPVVERGIGGTGAPAIRQADRGLGGTGGPAVREADRGLGGTGAPAIRQADRGLGGTGGPESQAADRGIGGTGIVGIVTGFASVCVAGLEVALDPRVPVDIDGVAAGLEGLRAGQIVAIAAETRAGLPVAVRISVRHEVSGPVEAVLSAEPGLIQVAGQRVQVPRSALGGGTIRTGDWVSVSGLRGPDGDVIASRLDPRAPGKVLVRGPLFILDGERAIGGLPVRTRRDPGDIAGTYVVSSGDYATGAMTAETILPDLVAGNPAAFFGPGTGQLVLQGHARIDGGTVAIAGGLRATVASGTAVPFMQGGPVVIVLRTRPDGALVATAIRPSLGMAPVSGAGMAPRLDARAAGAGLHRPVLQMAPHAAGAARAGAGTGAAAGGLRGIAPRLTAPKLKLSR